MYRRIASPYAPYRHGRVVNRSHDFWPTAPPIKPQLTLTSHRTGATRYRWLARRPWAIRRSAHGYDEQTHAPSCHCSSVILTGFPVQHQHRTTRVRPCAVNKVRFGNSSAATDIMVEAELPAGVSNALNLRPLCSVDQAGVLGDFGHDEISLHLASDAGRLPAGYVDEMYPITLHPKNRMPKIVDFPPFLSG